MTTKTYNDEATQQGSDLPLIDPTNIPYAAGAVGGSMATISEEERGAEKLAKHIAEHPDFFVQKLAGAFEIWHVPSRGEVRKQFVREQQRKEDDE